MLVLAHSPRHVYRRRDFVVSATVGVASWTLRGAFPAHAQGELDGVVAALEANRKNAEGLFEEVIYMQPSFDDKTADEITQQHYDLRFSLASLLYPLHKPSQVFLVDPEFLETSLIISAYNEIDLVPSPNEIKKIDVRELGLAAHTFPCDRYHAILFIVLDALGIDGKDLVIESIRDTSIQTKLEDLVAGYPDRDWETTAKQIVGLVSALTAPEFLLRLVRAGGWVAIKNMSVRMSLYLVPYTGYVYAGIVICAALKKNWRLLMC